MTDDSRRKPRRRAAHGRATGAPPRARDDLPSLLLAALARDDGVEVLLSAAPEVAAVTFGVHPDAIERVRAAAASDDPAPG